MPIITDIIPQGNQSRVNLYIDGEFFCGLFKETVLKHQLKVGLEVNQEKLLEILNDDQFEKAKNVAFHFLSYRPRSQKEIEKKLLEKEFHPEIVKRTVDYLSQNGFLDDKKFIESWIADKTKFAPCGLLKIQKELKERGVDPDLIKESLAFLKEKEKDLAKEALKTRWNRFKKLSLKEKKKKIQSFLYSRGFSSQTIWEILKEIK
jgi:regulatory protein